MQPAAISTDLLGVYAFYAALLVAKMLPMGLLTSMKRFATGVRPYFHTISIRF